MSDEVGSTQVSPDRARNVIGLFRLARAMEDAGYYNPSKLFRALAYAEEVRLVQGHGLTGQALLGELDRAIEVFHAQGVSPELKKVLEGARTIVAEDRTGLLEEVPPVFVCRCCGATAFGSAPDPCPHCGAGPLTYQEFPPVYFLEPLEPQTALAHLRRGPDVLESMFQGLKEEQAFAHVVEEGWSLGEAVSHLLDAETLFAFRLNLMLSEDDPELVAQQVWTFIEEKGALSTSREILPAFHKLRTESVERLQGLRPDDWQRTGRHSEFGRVTVQQQATYFAKHEQRHLAQMVALRSRLAA